MANRSECFWCSAPAQRQMQGGALAYLYECPSCGVYINTEVLEFSYDRAHLDNKYLIAGLLRRSRLNRSSVPKFSTESIKSLLTTANIPESPLDAMDLALQWLSESQTEYGLAIAVGPHDHHVAFCKTPDEFQYLLELLTQQRMIEKYSDRKAVTGYRLLPDGWQRARELKQTGVRSDQAFVAMWFDERMDDVWKNGFDPALREAGFVPIRSGSPAHNDNIINRILIDIRRSGLLVADFTGHRGGVYYEAGFGMGLNIPVVRTCREDHFEKLHFDTAQWHTITWSDTADLRVKLQEHIAATVISG